MATRTRQRLPPAGTIQAINASLTLVMLDAASAGAWEPLLEEPRGDDLGGHPQKVNDFYDAHDDFTHGSLNVGEGKAIVLRLEGATGAAEIYRIEGGALAFVEPPREWWDDEENYGGKASDVEALFAEALSPASAGGAKTVAKVVVSSSKLVVFDSNGDLKPLRKALQEPIGAGQVKPFGRDDAGVVVALSPGSYGVRRRVLTRPWAKRQPLVVAYLEAGAGVRTRKPAATTKPAPTKTHVARKPAGNRAKTRTPSAQLAAIIGTEPLTRVEVTKRLWAYILANKLLDKRTKTVVHADAKLKKVFGKAEASMFEMPSLVDAHLR